MLQEAPSRKPARRTRVVPAPPPAQREERVSVPKRQSQRLVTTLLFVILAFVLLLGVVLYWVFDELERTESSVRDALEKIETLDQEIRRLDSALAARDPNYVSPENQTPIQVPIPEGEVEFATVKSDESENLPESTSPYFVIIESTTSESDAIGLAVTLRELGYASEVIETTTGFFGIVLGRFEFEQAQEAKLTAVRENLGTGVPYLITSERIVRYVYPEPAKPSDR